MERSSGASKGAWLGTRYFEAEREARRVGFGHIARFYFRKHGYVTLRCIGQQEIEPRAEELHLRVSRSGGLIMSKEGNSSREAGSSWNGTCLPGPRFVDNAKERVYVRAS
jgi:hypothetical protein